MLLTGSTSGTIGLPILTSDESRIPFGSEEECQGKLKEGFVNSQRRFQPGHAVRTGHAGPGLSTHVPCRSRSCPLRYSEGHRLSNGLLAPQTC